jgi:hypothetical protein
MDLKVCEVRRMIDKAATDVYFSVDEYDMGLRFELRAVDVVVVVGSVSMCDMRMDVGVNLFQGGGKIMVTRHISTRH